MQVNLITVGSLKTDYIQRGSDEFRKRLSRYSDLDIIEVKAEKLGSNLSEGQKDKIKKQEAERIIDKMNNSAYSIALDYQGKHMTSKGLAKSISNLQVQGYSKLEFIIGGTLGLHDQIRKEADYVLALSNMTFTHEMARLILLEQIYRAFKILNGENYHR
ncbi:23S rRNA (pseudouridine(1915)-N(3))-methyltransferase RlmH [Sporohalobacter salinus]|uniref:23S rRNA (pseudouridine(1915)-N(3))-methyltransferase RlmH n=1 Tax=Sporohalobacter salinus TaxID=1494606 RepID=UPI00195FEFC9|nr:23S rRNA (pseudouridine(1915)-N(3))-methyltransferase RlmH [Sporohalobacter salinus]MBM7622853.1 23S rRNA (pseudouridine1915-N3)-methyltransferase [Sporohalobacter salinus]